MIAWSKIIDERKSHYSWGLFKLSEIEDFISPIHCNRPFALSVHHHQCLPSSPPPHHFHVHSQSSQVKVHVGTCRPRETPSLFIGVGNASIMTSVVIYCTSIINCFMELTCINLVYPVYILYIYNQLLHEINMHSSCLPSLYIVLKVTTGKLFSPALRQILADKIGANEQNPVQRPR